MQQRRVSNFEILVDAIGDQPEATSRPHRRRRRIAKGFRDKHGFPVDCDEVGVVCPDVIEAAKYLEDKDPGMGSFVLAEGGPKVFKQDGEERNFRTRVGFGYYQDVLMELAEPGTGSKIFARHLDEANGKITMHHMGFFARGDDLVRKVDGKKRKFRRVLEAAGYDAPKWEA